MADSVVVEKPVVIDLLTTDAPALSSTSDVPVVETKPDASNEGAPPAEPATIEGEATEVVDEAEQPGESATPATEEQSGQQTDKPRGVGKALAELRESRRQAEARAKAAEDRLETALRSLEQMTAKAEPAPEPVEDLPPVKPDRNAYPDPDSYELALGEYIDKRTAYEVEKGMAAARAKERSDAEINRIQETMRQAHDKYTQRKDEARKKVADFDEVALRADVVVPGVVVDAIINDERGPEIQYYFGKNPDEAKRLMAMVPDLTGKSKQEAVMLMTSVNQRISLELGKVMAKLDAPAPKPVVSKAPPPITPVKSAGDQHVGDPETMSVEEYAAFRRSKEGWADPQAKNKQGMARARH